MRYANPVRCALLALAAVTGNAAYAHHSQVLFDLNQCRTLAGTVHAFQYQYPHSWLWVVVPNDKGGEDIWGFEAAAPANMVAMSPRWTRDVVKKGDKVTVKFSPIKDGRTAGALATMILASGETLGVPAPACSGKPPARNETSSAK